MARMPTESETWWSGIRTTSFFAYAEPEPEPLSADDIPLDQWAEHRSEFGLGDSDWIDQGEDRSGMPSWQHPVQPEQPEQSALDQYLEDARRRAYPRHRRPAPATHGVTHPPTGSRPHHTKETTMTDRAAMGGGRGQWTGAGHGDRTGQILLQQEQEHAKREAGIRATKRDLGDGKPVELITVPVGTSTETYAIPRIVARALIQHGVQSD